MEMVNNRYVVLVRLVDLRDESIRKDVFRKEKKVRLFKRLLPNKVYTKMTVAKQ